MREDSRARVLALRRVVSNMVVTSHLESIVLGCEPAEYQRSIEQYNTWGGYIELILLSSQLQVEFVIMDIRQPKPYPTGSVGASRRVYLWYNGGHYNLFVIRNGASVNRSFLLDDLKSADLIAQAHARSVEQMRAPDAPKLPPPKQNSSKSQYTVRQSTVIVTLSDYLQVLTRSGRTSQIFASDVILRTRRSVLNVRYTLRF